MGTRTSDDFCGFSKWCLAHKIHSCLFIADVKITDLIYMYRFAGGRGDRLL